MCVSAIESGYSQTIYLKQTNENGLYESGEKLKVVLYRTSTEVDTAQVRMQHDFSSQSQKKMIFNSDSLVIFDETVKRPTTYLFEARSKEYFASIGSIVDPLKFSPGTKRPKDLNCYWNNQKKALKQLKMQIDSNYVNIKDTYYQCFNVEINCTGPKPARGFFAKPIAAKAKSLPIVIYFHAAGVNGDWCRSKPEIAIRYAKMGKGALSFDLNAHGMLNGQPDDYYNFLDSTELKNYAQTGLENKDSIYFLGMYLRLLRTIDFLTQQPEWDGKRILVMGESQGGGQALAAAGLDERVTAVVATVPAMCDWGGTLVGRKGSWPYPFATSYNREKMLETLPYFDVAHLIKATKATLVVEIGLIDQTCPSSAIYAALNQAKTKKYLLIAPYRAHHFTQKIYQQEWNEMIDKPKNEFISDFLK